MVKIPPPVWLALCLFVAGAAAALYPWRALIDLRLIGLGAVLTTVGAALDIWALALFRAAGTQVLPHSPANKALVIAGPYRFTRNPMYLGLVLVALGLAFLVGAAPFFVVPPIIFAIANSVHIPFEEAKMRAQFGAAFDAYTRKVRRWL